MRQGCWLELVKDYACEILSHLGKFNVVIDALSRGGQDRWSCLRQMAPGLATELTRSYIELVIGGLINISLESSLLKRISEQHLVDAQLMELRGKSWQGQLMTLPISETKLLR